MYKNKLIPYQKTTTETVYPEKYFTLNGYSAKVKWQDGKPRLELRNYGDVGHPPKFVGRKELQGAKKTLAAIIISIDDILEADNILEAGE